MKKKAAIAIAVLLVPVFAFAATQTYRTRSNDTLASVAAKYNMTVEQLAAANPNAKLVASQKLTVTVADPAPTPTPTPTPVPSNETRFNAYLTSYTYWDNTPPGSADISHPVIHSKAGGTGTYADPITLAVGHDLHTGKDVLDYPAGTKFYVPNLRAYFIVEDTCGDGARPENGPCHKNIDVPGVPWLDMWIDGASVTSKAANTCAENLTEVFLVIQNPASNYAVVPGSIISNGKCRTQYGNAVVTQ